MGTFFYEVALESYMAGHGLIHQRNRRISTFHAYVFPYESNNAKKGRS
jgi:hypothetical protein